MREGERSCSNVFANIEPLRDDGSHLLSTKDPDLTAEY